MLTLLIILNIILAAAAIIFVIKRILIDFIWSQKTIKNVIMVTCVIASLFLSFGCLKIGVFLNEEKDHLKYELSKSEGISIGNVPQSELIKDNLKNINRKVKEIEIYTAAGYLCYSISFLIYRSILIENTKIKPEGKWDLKDFK